MHTAVAVVVSFGIIQSIKLLTKVSGFCMLGNCWDQGSVTNLAALLPTLELRLSRCQSAPHCFLNSVHNHTSTKHLWRVFALLVA